MITNTSIHHLDITTAGTTADKIFERDARLAGCHIMGYKVNNSGQWCFLYGIGTNEAKQVIGNLQLYMIEKKQGQFLEGFVGAFAEMPVGASPTYTNSLFTFVEKKATDPVTRIHVMEIGTPNGAEPKFKKTAEVTYPPDVQGDFPVLLHSVDKYGLIFLITKFGYLFVYEAANAYLIYRQRITDSWIFAAVRNPKTDGMIAINRNGQMLAINVDQNAVISYIMNQCKHIPDNVGVAFKLATRHSLPGADDLFQA